MRGVRYQYPVKPFVVAAEVADRTQVCGHENGRVTARSRRLAQPETPRLGDARNCRERRTSVC